MWIAGLCREEHNIAADFDEDVICPAWQRGEAEECNTSILHSVYHYPVTFINIITSQLYFYSSGQDLQYQPTAPVLISTLQFYPCRHWKERLEFFNEHILVLTFIWLQ